ncbi:hypothetical protein ADL03_15675 [Nocardia sp. NRRL S-836]|nr:hypothetical protein ADL03_15675 [Nocardia sp. NRRL S-836]
MHGGDQAPEQCREPEDSSEVATVPGELVPEMPEGNDATPVALPLAHADLLAADAELCARFRATDCRSPEFRDWARELMVSTKKLLIALCKRGLIFKRTKETRFPKSGSFQGWDPTELDSLIHAVQAEAFMLLRDRGIRDGIWDPAKGATLRGYFLTGCVLVFAGRWKSWAQHHEHWSQLEMHDDVLIYADIAVEDSTGYEFDAQAVVGMLGGKLSNEQIDLLAGVAEGYTNIEMAEIFGTTPRAIAARLYRARNSAKPLIGQHYPTLAAPDMTENTNDIEREER